MSLQLVNQKRWIRLKFRRHVPSEDAYDPFDVELYLSVADINVWILRPAEEHNVLDPLVFRTEKLDAKVFADYTHYDKSNGHNRYVDDILKRLRFLPGREDHIGRTTIYAVLAGAVDPTVRRCEIEGCRSETLAIMPSVSVV